MKKWQVAANALDLPLTFFLKVRFFIHPLFGRPYRGVATRRLRFKAFRPHFGETSAPTAQKRHEIKRATFFRHRFKLDTIFFVFDVAFF